MTSTQDRIQRGQDINLAWSLVATHMDVNTRLSNNEIEALFGRYFAVVNKMNSGLRLED